MTIEANIEDPGYYINTLNDSYPASGDTLTEGDNHIRGIKNLIKNTFPNVTGEVTSTHTELNLLDGVTATTAELNILDGVTATAAEINYLDIATLGTGAASKAVVLDASSNYTSPGAGTWTWSASSTVNFAGTIQIGGVAVTSSAAELNYNDITTLGTCQAGKVVTTTTPGNVITAATITTLTSTTANITTLNVPAATLNITGVTAGTLGITTPVSNVAVSGGAGVYSTDFIGWVINFTGTVRVYRTHRAASTMYTQIYLNGVGVDSPVTGTGVLSVDVSVAEGDYLSIRGNCSSDGCSNDYIDSAYLAVSNRANANAEQVL